MKLSDYGIGGITMINIVCCETCANYDGRECELFPACSTEKPCMLWREHEDDKELIIGRNDK